MTPGGEDRGDRDALERAMAGVKPLARGKERVRPSSARTPARRSDVNEEIEFVREGDGSGTGFYARDLGRDPLLRLRREKARDELSVDVHGCRTDEARREIGRLFERAAKTGARRLRIVHGKGLHSETAPVLAEYVTALLQRPPLAAHVAAFGFAPLRESGTGATLVCLRSRPRRGAGRDQAAR